MSFSVRAIGLTNEVPNFPTDQFMESVSDSIAHGRTVEFTAKKDDQGKIEWDFLVQEPNPKGSGTKTRVYKVDSNGQLFPNLKEILEAQNLTFTETLKHESYTGERTFTLERQFLSE